MDTKNRLTNFLLKAAKKHRVLTYPVLALVALISVFTYLFNWSTGAGKRVVAVIMVMVMLVSQSYFLTSSATEVTDDSAGNPLVMGDSGMDMLFAGEDEAPAEETAEVSDDSIAPEVSDDSTDLDASEDTEVSEDADVSEDSDEDIDVEDDEDFDGSIGGKDRNDGTPTDPPTTPTAPTIQVIVDYSYNDGTTRSSITLPDAYIITGTENTEDNTKADYDLGAVYNSWLTFMSGDAYNQGSCFVFESVYLNSDYSGEIGSGTKYTVPKDTKTIRVYMKGRRTKYKVSVVTSAETGTDVSYTAALDDASAATETAANEYLVPVEKGLVLSNIKRVVTGTTTECYKISGASGGTLGDDGKITIPAPASAASASDVTLYLTWKPVEYKVLYSKDGTTTNLHEQTVKYDGSESFLPGADYANKKIGWTFDHWKVGSSEYKSGDSISAQQNTLFYDVVGGATPTVILLPVYTYKGIVVTDNLEINSYSYLDTISPFYIKGHYDKSTETGDFTYNINDIPANLSADFNIDVTATENGIMISSDGIKSSNANTPIVVKFQIEDHTNGVDPETGEYPKSQVYDIEFSIKQKTIKLLTPTSGASTSKAYDGTVATALDNVVGAPTSEAGITWSATGGEYNSPDVADADRVVYDLANVTLSCTADPTILGNYILNPDDCYVSANITPRTVVLQTSVKDPERAVIRAGEDNPEFTVSEVPKYKATPTNSFGIIGSEDDIADFLSTVTCTPDRPADKTAVGTYKILPSVPVGSNYEVDDGFNAAYAGSFEVVMESPDGKYTISDGTGLDGDWLRANSTIVAKNDSGYDTVYASSDGTNFSVLSRALTDADTRKDFYIYLYDKTTHAQTSVKKLDLKIDSKAPTYKGYTVVEADNFTYTVPDVITSLKNGGLYFPSIGSVLDFGTYIHTSMTVKVHYEDETSGLGEGAGLYYSLFGSGEVKGPLVFDKDGWATITLNQNIVAGADTKVGVITCYAKDAAGNPSERITLSPNKSDIYEWSIESKGPEVSPITAYSGSLKIASSTDYYHDCRVSIDVVDSISGLQKIVWKVNGQEVTDTTSTEDAGRVVMPSGKVVQKMTYQLPINQASFPSSNAYYEISATVYDNAGNSTTTGNSVAFYVDDVVPNLDVHYDPAPGEYTSDSKITFTTSDDLSGVKSAYVENPDGSAHNCTLQDAKEDGTYSGSFDITAKGKYTLFVEDKAGNVNSWTKEITNISKEVPDCPTFSVAPTVETEEGEDFWYNAETGQPTVTLSNVRQVSDGTPATTYYRHYLNDETAYDEATMTSSETSRTIKITDDGIHTFEYWSESAAGVKCETPDSHSQMVRYDGTAPTIAIEAEETSGSSIVVRYTVTDATSGVDRETVQVLKNNKPYSATIEETANGYTGTFTVKETGNYMVTAKDNAGNEAEVAGFTPMSMVVNAVTNITTSKANLSAAVFKGTSDISAAPIISLRKEGEEGYTELDSNVVKDDNGNWRVAAALENLTENTTYAYKVRAVSDIGEILEYEGYFRTLSTNDEGITFVGITGYVDGVIPESKNGMIAVGLYDGGVCIRATYVHAGDKFVFENVPDGSYNIVATDGTYSKTAGVIIQDGKVVKPSGTISLMLSGKNTAVVITTPETPKITAENMDSIFDFDTVNYTPEDRALVQANGTVEFKLYATLISVTAVSADEKAAMYAVTSKDKIVGAYLDLSLFKTTTDEYGNRETTQVTELSNGASVSVTIPLGELAGKPGLEVVRIHDTGDRYVGAVLNDQDSNPSTFTVVTNQFSTYAILYSPEEEPSSEDQSSEDPSSEDPSSEDKTTEKPPKTDKTTEKPPKTDKTTEKPPVNIDTPTTQAPHPIPENRPAKGASFSSVSSSSGYAKTGDETPIEVLGLMMMISLGGVFFIRRKVR